MSESNPLGFAGSFTDLVVYKRARSLSREVFQTSGKLPRDEAFSLTDQWRRASRSIGAQIAEAWAKRRYPKHFASKLTDADGEQFETQHWIITAFDSGYREEAAHLGELCKEVGRMLGFMIQNAASFQGDAHKPTLHEDPPEYDALDTEY